ncbi:MAG TPA: N-carbamoylputrescine amidase [Deltaproteobacteria bacterium]|nr:N-carbamoylputrescine amidase [Deltaproteobacteria bacterium]
MRNVKVAVTQMACSAEHSENIEKAENLVRKAADQGANVILLQELFETPYFCKDQNPEYFEWARPFENHPILERMSRLAKELGVVLPVSFFERSGNTYFNSLAMIDADGRQLGVYRKSHIPDGPGYQEKFYFSPGDSGFRVWETRFGKVGAGICWDQWFPETARVMALQGAEILCYPTAIGSEPPDPDYDSCPHWTRTMQGHAAANIMPVIASNRIGAEQGANCALTFYGSSLIAGPTGELLEQAGRKVEQILLAEFDLDEIQKMRSGWGIFRDRRPDLYQTLISLDGS